MDMETDKNAWDRAAEAEQRRYRRLGMICDEPSRDSRESTYEAGDVVTLDNHTGVIAPPPARTDGASREGERSNEQDMIQIEEGSDMYTRMWCNAEMVNGAASMDDLVARSRNVAAILERMRADGVSLLCSGNPEGHVALSTDSAVVARRYGFHHVAEAEDDVPIMTPCHPDWERFAEALSGAIDEHGCDSHSCRLARAILAESYDVDVEASLHYLREHGGYCDCEVLFNVV